jgi:hypothetical protein
MRVELFRQTRTSHNKKRLRKCTSHSHRVDTCALQGVTALGRRPEGISAGMSNSAAPDRDFRTDLRSLPRRASGRTWREIADVRNQAPAKVYLHLICTG